MTPAVAVQLERKEMEGALPQGKYLCAVALWCVRGVQDVEKMAYAALRVDDPSTFFARETAERLTVMAATKGKGWPESLSHVNTEELYTLANDHLFGELDRKYDQFVQDIRARNADRADLQLHSLEQHLKNQMINLQRTLDKHRTMGRFSLERATEGRMKALQGRVAQQRLKIENRREITDVKEEIALAIVNLY